MLSCWSHRYLSRAGRLTLIKSVLEATPVFWMALVWIPRNILAKLQQLSNRFLWAGNQDKRIFAWIGWNKIALPKKWGGSQYGIKQAYHPSGRALLHALPLIRENLAWRIRAGNNARIGLDPWTGSGGRHILPHELVDHLSAHNIKVIAQIVDQDHSDILHQEWKSAIQLNLPRRWHAVWEDYRATLIESHIHIIEGSDELVWNQSDHGIYTPKDGYIQLIAHKKPEVNPRWWQSIWKQAASPRAKLFNWCILRNKIPTGEHLMKRAQHGPTWCVLCKEDSESTDHMFLRCRATETLWQNLKPFINFNGDWAGTNLINAWTEWESKNKGSKNINLPIIVNWSIWKSRNRAIFDNKPIHWPLLETGIISALKELPDPPPPSSRQPAPPPPIDQSTLGILRWCC
eukprot:PITA_14871